MFKKYLYLLVIFCLLFLGKSQAPEGKSFDSPPLSGNISLTLKQGVGKLWNNQPIFQDITLDLSCDRGRCDSEVWAYAPKFNQDVDHRGTVEVIPLDKGWQIKVNLSIKLHPWQTEQKPAYYDIQIIPYKDQLIGSYSGNFNQFTLQNRVKGTINPLWPVPISNHQVIQPQEHPRLIFRKSQLKALREKAKTPEGNAILNQLKKTLRDKVYYTGYVPNGGYHAAGYCFLYQLEADRSSAERAWKLVENSINKPGPRLLEQSPIVAGVALAYDLCYSGWNQQQRDRITRWLNTQADRLLKGDTARRGWNNTPWSNWNARAKGAAGLAALAIVNEPSLKPSMSASTTDYQSPLIQAKIAERNIQRYLLTAIGNQGFGTEGDHYTTEPLILTVIPFLLAYQNVMGQDLVKDSRVEAILPLYLMRIMPKNYQLPIATYGRHRRYAGGPLFAMGLKLVPESFLPGMMWLFDSHLGLKGDKTFGVESPYQAIYALVAYPSNIVPKNPAEIFDRVLVDEQKGFYVFRDRWQDDQDFVASIYLKKEPLGRSWSFPDVGSFRIWGLGEKWAIAGKSEQALWDDENVVIMPKSQPWIGSLPTLFQSGLDGSGVVSLVTQTKVKQGENKPPLTLNLLRSFGVDYSKAAGVPGVFVVVDQFMGSVDAKPFKEKVWTMHTEGKVSFDQQSFLIQAANGATMKGTFITPEKVKLSYQKTDLGGKIMATGGDNFFVVMTVQKGKIPEVKIEGKGLDAQIKIGKQEIFYDRTKVVFSKF